MELLVQLIIIVLIFGVAQWAISSLKIPEVPKNIAIAILAIFFVLVLMRGYQTGHFLR